MDVTFHLTSEVQGSCLVIATSGYINNIGGETIATEFNRHLEKGTKHVVINLAQSKVVNSIGISFLLEIIEKLEDVSGKVIFTNLDPAVDKMLTIMGIFKFAGKASSVAEALKSFA
jgi:stage II sporulation protein AA (anti-sigma F factor antagonist)